MVINGNEQAEQSMNVIVTFPLTDGGPETTVSYYRFDDTEFEKLRQDYDNFLKYGKPENGSYQCRSVTVSSTETAAVDQPVGLAVQFAAIDVIDYIYEINNPAKPGDNAAPCVLN
jgi:hypothetical protein